MSFKNSTEDSYDEQLGHVPADLCDPRLTGSMIRLIDTINTIIINSTRRVTRTPSSIPVHQDPPAPPVHEVKVEAMPQSLKKIHAVFYAFITAAVLLLKTTELQSNSDDTYHPLLNYGRVKFVKITESSAYYADTILLLLGLSYGGFQVAAQTFRHNGKHMFDSISVFLGGSLVCALMLGVSSFCGFIVTVVMFGVMGFLHKHL